MTMRPTAGWPALSARMETDMQPNTLSRSSESARLAVISRSVSPVERSVVNSHAGMPRAKRLFDLFVSGLGLLASIPLWAVIAVGIKLEDGGPAFYCQERVGKGGRRFRSGKFRSMVQDSDERFGPLQAMDGLAGDARGASPSGHSHG